MKKGKGIIAWIVTLAALLVVFLYAVNTGSLKVTPVQLFKGLFISYDPQACRQQS